MKLPELKTWKDSNNGEEFVTLSDAQQAIKDAYEQGKKDAISDIVSCHIASRAAPKQEKNDEPV